MKVALAALVLSVIALGVAIGQPIWRFYSTPTPAVQGEPLFIFQGFDVLPFDTQIYILNNGTGMAHDIKVTLAFSGGNTMAVSEFISELDNQTFVTLAMPLGSFQLTYGGQELSFYQGRIAINCKELNKTTNFAFDLQ